MENRKHGRSIGRLALLLIVAVLAIGTPVMVSSVQNVQAASARTGWVQKGSDYYYFKNGAKVRGDWVKDGNYWYYLKPTTGLMAKSEFVTLNGKTYYLQENGRMAIGWLNIEESRYYFNSDGSMQTGLLKLNGKRYYFRKSTGKLMIDSVFRIGEKTYWTGADGSMQTGFKVAGGKKYYFTIYGAKRDGWYTIGNYKYYMDKYGACLIGWQTIDEKKYYFVQSGNNMGVMMKKGIHTIDSKKYEFDTDGSLIGEATDTTSEDDSEGGEDTGSNDNPTLNQTSSGKTIKNFLLGALQPVGSTLYVWGGGWAEPTTNYKGVYPTWKTWYNANSGSYDYSLYKDLSTTTRMKGLDCSGFVGWSTYQIMQSVSGGPSYVAEASTIASYYAGKGYGTLLKQSTLSQNGYLGQFKPGDVASRTGHCWIVMGQCDDGSLVIVHSTPPCVQIAGTPTPSGSYSSQAVTLAKTYMQRYYPSTVEKFSLGSQTANTYITASNIMRWNDSTLKDPEGYRDMNAAEVLADLFGE